ncbi:MAG TPA: amidohydrolase [Burkholderiales bacterium]|jgi:cytosine/adenosine deaminase-related metal-dependent hydrolase
MSSLLIENAAVLTLDEADRFIERGGILIEGNTISQVGAVARGKADRVIDGRRFLAVPGLVNAHTHTPGALSAGTQDSASHPAFMWLNQADTSGRTPREVYVSAMLNSAQMLLGGITTSIDHFPAQNFGPDDVAAVVEAHRDSGMRTVLGLRVFDDDFGDIFPSDRPLPADLAKDLERIKPLPPKPLAETRKLIEDSVRLYHRPRERVSVFPAPTNPVRCSDELLTMCRDLAERHDLGIHTHLLESKVQTSLAQRRYGRTMVQQLERLGLLSPRLSCAHTIWIDDEDIVRLAATGTVVVHNPESNLKLGTGIAPVAKMLAAGVTVALGTDGSVTNDNLVLHEAIRLAAMLGRVAERERSKWVTARQALAMATAGGARAVQMPKNIGRIQAGYRADVVLYDLDTPAWTPFNDPVQQMVFAETGSSVHTVIVDGVVVVEDREIKAFDAAAVIAEAKPMLRAIRSRNGDLYRFARRMGELFP